MHVGLEEADEHTTALVTLMWVLKMPLCCAERDSEAELAFSYLILKQ